MPSISASGEPRKSTSDARESSAIETALRQANRALRLFSRCNSAVVHATDEHELLVEICRIAVEDAGYRMAWVGRAEHDAAKSVRPLTFAGNGAGFLERVRVTWGDDEYGRGTAGTAIRTRRPAIGRDLLHDARFAVWREALREYGYKSAVAMPLQFAHEVHGVLLIYASEPDAFDSTEVSLLEELGGNVSHGLLALRSRRKLAEAMAELESAHRELERRAADRTRELAESRENYRELVENANSIILRMDTSGRITFANEFATTFFGYPELVGRSVTETIVPATDSTGRDLSRMMDDLTNHPERYAHNENENVRKNGERVWIAWTNKPILDRAGRLVGLLCIGNDITTVKRSEAELVRARDAAESAGRLKSAILASMSHELRTPLNSILGFTGILLHGLAGPLNDEQKKQLGMVQGSARHLLSLINDVLDISKIEAGQLTVLREPFDVRASLDRVVQTLGLAASTKGLALEADIAANVDSMVGDKRRFEQVVINLVGNAVKFTERGRIALRCFVRQGNLVVTVQDTGIGIPREQFPQLFRPFFQVDTGTARRHEGSGLGLSISKRLVDRMGGNLTVESTVGVGTEFTVTLPLARGDES